MSAINYDILLTIGCVILIFAIPSMVSAISDSRRPRVSAISLLVGGALVLYPLTQKPGGYTLDDIPRAMVRVVAEVIG